MTPILSILIPTVPERQALFSRLFDVLKFQTQQLPVEILTLSDNRMRSIGLKRNALLSIARGKYVAFCDDDDMVAENYASTLCDMASFDRDVLCFNQFSDWNGNKSTIEFRIHYPINGIYRTGGITKRFPWHICAWRREVAQQCIFTDRMFGEDVDWVRQAEEIVETEAYSPKILHYYTHSEETSLAHHVDTTLKT
jgi:glycosyltransferase involved in cell wall biosynthesis